MSWYTICACMKERGGRILDAIAWKAILDDFDKLATEGITGEDGVVWYPTLVFGGGDMEQLCVQWGLRNYNDSGEMCFCCLANRSDKPYTNLQITNDWAPTEILITNEVWLNNRECYCHIELWKRFSLRPSYVQGREFDT